MKMTQILFGALLALGGTTAMAEGQSMGTGLFLEPGVTYQMTESNIDYPNGAVLGNSQVSTRGFGVVGRAGIHVWERFFIAADARYALLKYEDNANNQSMNASSWDIAPTIGVQMADYGVRLYGGYILAGNLDPKSANGYDLRFEDPTGWRVGAGLKLQSVSVNFEWQRISYGKTTLSGPTSISTDAVELNSDGLVASVTFPFEFN